MVAAPTPVEIFCCYSHEDETWLRKLETHLSLLQRQGLISLWHDRRITPGTDWAKAMDTHLETASVILLLVSADFLASDYSYGVEMKRALERHEAGEARVIPVLVRPVDWKAAPFAHLQSLPTDTKPLTTWRNKDTAMTDVVAGIRRVIGDVSLLAASAPRATLPKIWNVPYPRNPFFLGRDTELAQVRHHLQAGQATALAQPQAISGLGGIGKTQLALEYAYRYHQDYQMVLWARAESTEALVSSYIALATLLRLPEREAREQDIAVQAVKTWLQTHRDWLLILDNADELALLPDFLPSSLGGHLLLTTRAAATGRLAHRMEIEALFPEQSALLLLRRAGLLAPDAELSQASQEERELALQISEELGGLPLALDQAGAYLEETAMGLPGYWDLYQQHRADLLQQRGGLVADHPTPVATTWSLSFRRVEEGNPAAAELLRLCTYLAPDAISEEILTTGASFLGPVLAPVAADAFQLNRAIEALRAYSLVRRDPREKTLSVHRLVQAVLQETLEEREKHLWSKRAVFAVNVAFPSPEKAEAWPTCQKLLLHVRKCTEWIFQWKMMFFEAAQLLTNLGNYLQERGQFEEAESMLQNALGIYEQITGSESLLAAKVHNYLGIAYWQHGKYEQSEASYVRALPIQERLLGPCHSDLAETLNNLGVLYCHQGKHTQAVPFYQRALAIWEQVLKPDDPLVAYAIGNLAVAYDDLGKYSQSEELYYRSLAIRENALGAEHPEVATDLNNLAVLYRSMGKHSEAEPLLRRALSIVEQAQGMEHPRRATTLDNLAQNRQELGLYDEAEVLYQHALVLREKVLGSQHPFTAISLSNLGKFYLIQGKYDQAEAFLLRALDVREKSLGTEHLDIAFTLTGLALLYREQGKYAQAEQLYQRALHIREQQLGSEHPDIAGTLHGLAQLREAQGNSEEARVWYARALAVREQALGAHHPKTRETRAHLIALLRIIGQPEEAAQLEAAQPEP